MANEPWDRRGRFAEWYADPRRVQQAVALVVFVRGVLLQTGFYKQQLKLKPELCIRNRNVWSNNGQISKNS